MTAQAVTIEAGRYTVKLRSVGNPDLGQRAAISERATVFVDSLPEASAMCRKYILEWELGGGNWPTTYVVDRETGKKVALISYNGRIWNPSGEKEIAQ